MDVTGEEPGAWRMNFGRQGSESCASGLPGFWGSWVAEFHHRLRAGVPGEWKSLEMLEIVGVFGVS